MKIKSIFSNSGGIFLSRIFGFVRDLLMASILGANIYSDIFAVAFKLPNLFRRIFAEGAFTQSFMPSFVGAKYKSIFSAKVLLLFLGILIFMSILVGLFAAPITKLIAPGFSSDTIAMSVKYVAIQFWYLPLIFVVTFLGSLLQYKEHFATTAFATVLLNIALIIAMLLYKGEPKEHILLALSWGVIAGGLLQVALHIIVASRFGVIKILKAGFSNLDAKRSKVKKDLNRFYKSFLPAIWGNSTAQFMSFLDTWVASFLAAGSISYLYYANRIFQLPLALFAIALSVAIFPTITKKIKAKDEKGSIAEFRKGFWILTYLLTAATIVGITFSNEMVWLLFERGEFTRANTIEVGHVLQMYLVGLIPYGLSKLFNTWLYANHKQAKAAKIATISLIVYAVFVAILVKPLGAMGLALAGSMAGFSSLIFVIKEFGIDRLNEIIIRIRTVRFIRNISIFTIFILFIKFSFLHI